MPVFEKIFARDPANPNDIASNATITLFDPADPNKTPVALTKMDGTALANPYTVNRQGEGPAFKHESLYIIGWEGGGRSNVFVSTEQMHADTLAARTAAENSVLLAQDAQAAATNAGATAADAAEVELAARIAAGDFQGPKGETGLPGPDAIPADEAVATYATTPGTATAAAISSTIDGNVDPKLDSLGTAVSAATGIGRRTILMGDSITAYSAGGNSTATPKQGLSPSWSSNGIHAWANVMLGHRLDIIGNSGIPGQETAQILSRFQTDVLDYNPDIVTILAGTNDDGPEDNTAANLEAMYDLALGQGVTVVAHTIPPSTDADSIKETHRLDVNTWLRGYVKRTPGVILADIAEAWHDKAQAGFKAYSWATADGTHPNTRGAQVAGRVVADALSPVTAGKLKEQPSSKPPYNLLENPFFAGSGTTAPTGWVVTGAPAMSYLPRSEGNPGQRLQMVVPDAGFAQMTSNINIGTTLAVGEKFDFRVEFEVQDLEALGTNTQRITAYTQQWNGTAWSGKTADVLIDGSASFGNARYPLAEGALEVPGVTVLSGQTLVQVVISVNGGGTYRVKGASVRNLTKIG